MKKLLSILLALCVLSTVAVPAFATEQPDLSIDPIQSYDIILAIVL